MLSVHMRVLSFVIALAVTAGVCYPPTADASIEPPPPAKPRNCKNTVSFKDWYRDFAAEAEASGIRRQTIRRSIGNLTPDMKVVSRDRKQSFFSQTFVQFYGKLATASREKMGRSYLKTHRAVFDRAEKEFGVPGPVITGFWALESDFGIGMGKLSVMRSLVTLAWDCRRGEMFREELKAALKIIDDGILTPNEMIGSWAGELGQTQFLPRHYLNYALDYNNNGRRDMMSEIPDVIGSTAGFIKDLGWRRGEPWIEEVRLTKDLPWDQADLVIKHPRATWVKWGVQAVDGTLPDDTLGASLLLPMGRKGPAFLAYQNFDVYLKWNQSLTYAMTAAHLAHRMGGGKKLQNAEASDVKSLSYDETKTLQKLLRARGHDVGEIDGKIGAGTRAAVKAVQVEMGFPADSYPNEALLSALQRSPR